MLKNLNAASGPAGTPAMAAQSILNAPDDLAAEQASESDIAKRSPRESAREYWIATALLLIALAGWVGLLVSVAASMIM